MAVRPIDANAMLNELRPVSFEAEHSAVLLSDVSKMMREWVERQPTLTPPNELLTLDQLRKMDGEPVWVELYRAWALVEVKQNGNIMFYGNSFSCPYSRTWRVYRFRPDRRPPEGEIT